MDNPVVNDATDFVELLSQLEESKFLRLFRHLVDGPDVLGIADNLRRPAVPLDLPDAELHLKTVGEVSSLRSFAVTWCFQIAHLPSCFWHADYIKTFINKRLRQAFENLKATPNPLATLKGVIDVPDRWSNYPVSEGYDYYLFTNICHDLNEESLNQFVDVAHNLFSEILDVPRDQHPRFGMGTPETFVGKARSEVRKFILDLLNMPSSYYLVAREGQISVIPMTEHGAFLAACSDTRSNTPIEGLSTIVTSALSGQSHPSPPGLSELQDLINSRKTKESDLQRFFEINPHFLFALDERYCEIRPHVCLFDAKRERLVPDFMARVQDSGVWDVIELKRPQHVITVRDQGIDKVAAEAARGIAELLQYREFFSTRDNRNRIIDRFGTAPYEPCLVLVIGRGRSHERYEWRGTRVGFPRVQVVSYDYLFQRARECSTLLSQS